MSDLKLVRNMKALFMANGIIEYLISPLTLSFSYKTKIRIKFIPKRIFSMSFERPPRYRTSEHCSISRKMLTNLCQF